MVDTSDEWITTRTGIKQRHIADKDTATSDLALEAAKKALADAGMAAEELTHIFLATITPDTYCPSAACFLEEKLGLRGLMAVDVNAACSGFLYTLQLARATVALEPDAKVLMVPAEVLSSRTNWQDRTTCVLFGDGAGAAVVTAGAPGDGVAHVEDVILSSDGSLADLLGIRGGGSGCRYDLGDPVRDDFFIHMNGREVFKNAVRNMESITQRLLDKHGVTPDDVDVFVPHQANLRIIEAVGNKLGFDPAKVFVDVDRFGNTSAASVPIALGDARERGVIAPGHRVLVTTFGAGFTWGAALLQF
jgi:3-oxoacyl-[acyl-carrier-protein] synthase-3